MRRFIGYLASLFVWALLLRYLVIGYQAGIGLSLVIVALFVFIEFNRYLKTKHIFSKATILGVFVLLSASTFALRLDYSIWIISTLNILIILPIYIVWGNFPNFLSKINDFMLVELIWKIFLAPVAMPGQFIFNKLPKVIKGRFKISRNIAKVLMLLSFSAMLTLPLLLVILSLLGSADPIFGQAIAAVKLPEIIDIWGYVFALLVSGFIWLFVASIAEFPGFSQVEITQSSLTKNRNEWYVSVVPLLLMNLTYFIFVLFQARYFFGGAAYVQENGINYSTYAINGFWEMIAVCALNAVVLFIIYQRISFKSRWAKLAIIPNVLVVIATSLILAVTAFNRISIYIDQYGYSVDRIWPLSFLLFILLAILVFLFTAFLNDERRGHYLVVGLFLAAQLYFALISLFSFNSILVSRNIDLYNHKQIQATKGFDMRYYLREQSFNAELQLQLRVDITAGKLDSFFTSDTSCNDPFDLIFMNGSYTDKACVIKMIDYNIADLGFRERDRNWQSWNSWNRMLSKSGN